MSPRAVGLNEFGIEPLSHRQPHVTSTRSAWHREGHTDLNQIIDRIVRRNQDRANAAGLTLTFAPTADLPLIKGNGYWLTQMLEAVVISSLQHTCTGWIKIATSHAPTAATVIIDIFDSRDGFCFGELADASETRAIALRHRGAVFADSTPGLGSRFSVQIPILP